MHVCMYVPNIYRISIYACMLVCSCDVMYVHSLLYNVSTVTSAGRSGIPVFEILLVRGIMILSISYMKAVTATQHTFPYALGQR